MKRIERAWQGFEKMVLPPTAGEIQRTEMRKAFFAGASVLFTIMTHGVSDDPEPTADDLVMMAQLDTEIREFGGQFDAEHLPKLARGDA
jgi:hypothetical protein